MTHCHGKHRNNHLALSLPASTVWQVLFSHSEHVHVHVWVCEVQWVYKAMDRFSQASGVTAHKT